MIGVLFAWHSTRAPDALPRGHAGEAIRADGRYIAASPVLRVILARAGAFIFFSSAIWALVPLSAKSVLHLGSGGYGLLLGSVGIGAVAGPRCCPGCAHGCHRTPCWARARLTDAAHPVTITHWLSVSKRLV